MHQVEVSATPRRLPARPATLAALVALAALPVIAGLLAWLTDSPLGMDSAVYRAGALTLLHGDPLYDTPTLPEVEPTWALLPFTYPPFAALLFVPLAAFPVTVAWGVLGACSVLALALVIRLSIGGSRARWIAPATLAGTLVALLLEPVWRTISFGQINLILLALIMMDVLVIGARGSRWGGVAIGVAAAVKLTPLIFVAHLLFIGRWRDALRALGTFLALQGLMFLIIPHDAARYWTHAVSDPARIGTIHWSDNQSLNGLLLRLTGSADWTLLAALGIGAVLALFAVPLMSRLHRAGRPLAALLVTAFFGLLVSPVSWTHHWVWLVPLLVMLAARASSRWDWAGVAALFAVFASYVVLVLPGGRDPDLGWTPLDHVLGNAYLLAVLVLTLVLGVRMRVDQARA